MGDANSSVVGCPTPRPTSWGVEQIAISVSGSGGKAFHRGGGGAVVWCLSLIYCFLGVAVVISSALSGAGATRACLVIDASVLLGIVVLRIYGDVIE